MNWIELINPVFFKSSLFEMIVQQYLFILPPSIITFRISIEFLVTIGICIGSIAPILSIIASIISISKSCFGKKKDR